MLFSGKEESSTRALRVSQRGAGRQSRGLVSLRDGTCKKGKGLLPRTEKKSSGGKRSRESGGFPDLGGEPCSLGDRRGFYMAQVSFPQNKS